jgi:hypothetical protein
MANHCFYVVCTGCGRSWCARGCGWKQGPDPERAEKYRNATSQHIVNDAQCSCSPKAKVVME